MLKRYYYGVKGYSSHSKKTEKKFSRTVIAECRSKVLRNAPVEYFLPALSYHMAVRLLFCLFFEWPLNPLSP